MNVRQLIKRLEKLDPKLPVYCGSGSLWPASRVRTTQIFVSSDTDPKTGRAVNVKMKDVAVIN